MKNTARTFLLIILFNFSLLTLADDRDDGTRQLISSGSKWEELAAYSRAVVDGEWIFISGTAGINPENGQVPEGLDAQMDQIFKNLETTLAKAGAGLEDLVRLRCYIVDRKYVMPMSKKLHEYLADIRPANLTIVTQLPMEEALIEIEATARKRK
ncbi:MAG: enamine deaminase RidA (YjgF/YER057c/UK114 family) [Gammaproteobacteria bacterium]|jgi:enamine deaminase RidA (YjgF/YER057c/UK114 family)